MLTMTPARWLLVLSLALSLLVVGPPPAAHAQAGGVTLNLVSWSYGVEIVRDNLGKFQQRYPGVSVNYSDFSWATYHDAMVARFVSKTPTDVLYSSDHWLQEWAAAGWIIPIDESFPQVRPYLSEYSPFVREALTYEGRIYGTADALGSKKIRSPTPRQAANVDQSTALQSGAATFGIIPAYSLAVLNDPGQTQQAGKFKNGLMPGESRATVGFIPFYAISSQVPRRGKEAMTAAWNFLDYFGWKTDREYRITKRWSLEKGLGFAQTALFADKDIRAAFGKWADVDMLQKQAQLARAKEGMTPYYGTWDVFSRAELHKAYLGQQKPVETLANMAKKWEELKAKAK